MIMTNSIVSLIETNQDGPEGQPEYGRLQHDERTATIPAKVNDEQCRGQLSGRYEELWRLQHADGNPSADK